MSFDAKSERNRRLFSAEFLDGRDLTPEQWGLIEGASSMAVCTFEFFALFAGTLFFQWLERLHDDWLYEWFLAYFELFLGGPDEVIVPSPNSDVSVSDSDSKTVQDPNKEVNVVRSKILVVLTVCTSVAISAYYAYLFGTR
jgi:hypothetical protein